MWVWLKRAKKMVGGEEVGGVVEAEIKLGPADLPPILATCAACTYL